MAQYFCSVALFALLIAIIPITSAQQTCSQYGSVPDIPPYSFRVNEWGADGSGQTCIELSENGTFTATWHYGSNPRKVHSYPNIALATPQLPLRLSTLGNLNVTVSWFMDGSNRSDSSDHGQLAKRDSGSDAVDGSSLDALNATANVAFDLFMDTDPMKATSTTAAQYEAMIWLGRVGSARPAGADDGVKAQREVGGISFSLRSGVNLANQTVYSWLADSNVTTIDKPVDFSPLLLHLLNNSLVPQDVQLGTFQFGTETFHATHGAVNFTAQNWNFTLSQKQTAGAKSFRDWSNWTFVLMGLLVSLLA